MIKDILKYVYDKKGGHTTRDKVGEVLYNRGIINAIYDLEAIRTAQGKFGKKPLKGEEVRWGYEHLDITAAADRRARRRRADGADPALLRKPRGQRQGPHSAMGRQALEVRLRLDPAGPRDADRDVHGVGPKYAKEKGITPRDCAKVM